MTPPSSIAHYRIIAKLGEGGMGAVYRATDTKLNREVAIKVLPDALANDPDYLARFTREAQVLASLNHPNIAIIHGVEERALVMELVPGETLEEKIAAGPIALEEVLGIAAQIADALEAAHERGVIHRDLKPANVKVTPEGVVKVLDFGLAKAVEPAPSTTANSPTLTIRATQAGLIMGTAGYMAPEQAAGKPVDRRADIWSFGVVLHELLTGKRLFTGETVSHTLASVLKDPIDCEIPRTPAPIRRLLGRCLNRNPKERLRDIGEARIAIRQYLANPAAEAPAVAADVPARGLGYWLPRAGCVVLSLALAAAMWWIFKPAPPAMVTRLAFSLGAGQEVAQGRLALAISPDGTQMVYAASGQLFLRSMSGTEVRRIAGSTTSGAIATNPVFSPDGKWVAFLQSGSMMRIPVSGGAAVPICKATNSFGISWGEGGILFGIYGKGILRVAASGGEPGVLIASKGDETMAEPQMLPGGEAVLYSLGTPGSTGTTWDNPQLVAQNLKSGARKIVAQSSLMGRFLPTGHLIYLTNGVLYAAPFDARRLEITGSPVAMVEGVAVAAGTAQIACSSNGTLIYLPGPVTSVGAGQTVLARVDRKGSVEPLKVPFATYAAPRVSREGRRVAYHVEEAGEAGIWVWDLAGTTAPRRLTLPGTGGNRYPVWSPDGRQVAYESTREGDSAIWVQRADGGGIPERLTTPGKEIVQIPDSWSPDGQTISFTERKGGVSEVWTVSVRDRKPALFASLPGALLGGSAFSPDGHWVAYHAWGGRIYVQPFPPPAAAIVAPQDGDTHHPVWSRDGKELFYVAGPSQVGSMAIQTTPNVSFGTPVRAPRSGFNTAMALFVRTFDVQDGEHFIGVVPAGQDWSNPTAMQIQVVLNWFEDVKQRATWK